MKFPADMMVVFLGVLSEFFTSSPQNCKVSFPSAKTWFDKFKGFLVVVMSNLDSQIIIFLCIYLEVVIFTLVGVLHAEVGEVEFDPVTMWGSYVPHYVLVVRVWLRKFGRGEAPI